MVVTIHQPEHLPWLGFCHKASQADLFVLLDNVQYRKNYFQNRNRILGVNGPMWVTVPVLSRGHTESTILDMRIDNTGPWLKKWWKSLYFTYKNAPFFEPDAAFFEDLSRRTWTSLVEFNVTILSHVLEAFEIRCPVVRASTLPVSGTRSDLLLDICRHVGATTYLAGQSGRDYLREDLFTAAGLAVRYHAFTHPVYPQGRNGAFVPFLSSVDLLWTCGPESARILRTEPWVAPQRP